ncbi:MAG: lysophospholipid acyltransferase family protein [Planctomycetes bacterium]|nr:lysophospholipid acyltransferase family protein [Planctomycetota bacterium]
MATSGAGFEADARRPTFGERLTALWFRSLQRGFQSAPAWVADSVADALAPVVVFWTRRHERRVAPKGRGLVRNQRIVFRDRWNEEFSDAHLRRWARHMTHCIVDFCRMPRITAASLERFVDMADQRTLDQVLAEGRGAICATGHFGFWELCSHVASVHGVPATTVYRPLRNPALDAEFRRVRSSGGPQLVPKWGAVRETLRALADGRAVGLAVDENTEHSPVFVPFLGTLAATNTTVAALAFRTGAPIVVVSCNRTGRERFKFHVWDVIRMAKSRPSASDIEAVMRRVNDALGRAVERYPEQWLWGARRFATRPPGETPMADGLPPIAELEPSSGSASP